MYIVDLSQFFPVTWLIHLIRAMIAFNIASILLEKKKSTTQTFLASTLIPLFFSFITLNIPRLFESRTIEFIISILYYALIFVINVLMYKGALKTKIIASVFGYITYLFSTLIATMLITVHPDVSIEFIYITRMNLSLYLTMVFGTYMISLLPTGLLMYYLKRRKNSFLKQQKHMYLFLVPFSHILCVFLTFTLYGVLEQYSLIDKPEYRAIVLISDILITGCFLFDVFLFFTIDRLNEIEAKGLMADQLAISNKIYYESLQNLKDGQQELNKFKHDSLNLISTLNGYIKLGEIKKAQALLTNMTDNILSSVNYSICQNSTINTILSLKKKEASDKSIKLCANYIGNQVINIDDYDLCRLMLNLIDNSINSAQNANSNYCKIEFNVSNDVFSITTKNAYLKETPVQRKGHGYGVKIIKDIAKKYNGNYHQEKDDTNFYTLTTLSNISK